MKSVATPEAARGLQVRPCRRPLGSSEVQPASTVSSLQHDPGLRAGLVTLPSVLIAEFPTSACPLHMGTYPRLCSQRVVSGTHTGGCRERAASKSKPPGRPCYQVFLGRPTRRLDSLSRSLHLLFYSISCPSSQSAADGDSALNRLIYRFGPFHSSSRMLPLRTGPGPIRVRVSRPWPPPPAFRKRAAPSPSHKAPTGGDSHLRIRRLLFSSVRDPPRASASLLFPRN